MKRIKFRIHGGAQPGKYAYNVPEGAKLNLNSVFRPVTGREPPAYSLEAGENRTRITLHRGGDSWNGKKVAAGSYEVRVGHILTSEGVTVEMLDCPEPPAQAGRENTQFLDLRAVQAEPATREVRADFRQAAPEVSVEVPLVESAPVPSMIDETSPENAGVGADADDKIVMPISFIPAPEGTRDIETAPTKAPTPLPPAPRAADPAERGDDEDERPAANTPPRFGPRMGLSAEPPSVDPMRARRATLQRAGLVACGFVIAIVVSNQIAQRNLIDIPVPEPVVINVTQTPQRHVVAPVPEVAVVPLPVMAPEEASRTPASAPEPVPAEAPPTAAAVDSLKGAKLAAAGKDLMAAVEEGNLKLVTKLIETDGVSPDFTIDDLGRSPFVRAASAGRVSVMQFLLSKKVAVDAVDFNGNTALMWSAINGHEKTASFLLTLGLSPSAKREDGKTAIVLARQYRQKAIEKLLTRAPASAKK